MAQPLCWITNSFDRSPAELLWVKSKAWGPLDGTLLNLSYGYGQAYVVPHEEINGQVQGGMCALPLPRMPTGIMRGRFHKTDGQLRAILEKHLDNHPESWDQGAHTLFFQALAGFCDLKR